MFGKLNRFRDYLPVTQKHPMGCAIACVASRCRINYDRAHQLFEHSAGAWLNGYTLAEVAEALLKQGLEPRITPIPVRTHSGVKTSMSPGTIAFLGPSSFYPSGHYFLKTQHGWMNPWLNFPNMLPARAGIQPHLFSRPDYLIFSQSQGHFQVGSPNSQ